MVEYFDALIVGAGLSGVAAGHYMQANCPWASYAVFEARADLGGTWDLFRYPGVRSDSDMFTLGYSFRPWPGERSLGDGASIRRYIEETAATEGVDRHIRFHHRVLRAAWSSDDALWRVTAQRTDTGETVEVRCRFLLSCTGYYRYEQGYLPDFAGMDRFGGELIHPQQWPEGFDYAGKRVVVIGSGATAVTLVPAMAEKACHVTMLQRSPSYVASIPGRNPIVVLLRRLLPKRWADPAIRWLNAVMMQGFYQLSRRRPELVKKMLRKGQLRELPPGYPVDVHFKPSYSPWDQRMCFVPNGDLFGAIRKGAASVVTDQIDAFTETGIRLRSGDHLDADVVVTATGLDMLFMGGIELAVDGATVDPATRLVYKGMMLEDVPNLAVAVGYTNASWTLKCELSCDYATRLFDRMHDTHMRQVTPVNSDPTIRPEPLMGLNSGYIQRAEHRLPKSGSKYPWQVYQSYIRDYRALKTAKLDDGVVVFSNPGLVAVSDPASQLASA